MPDWLIYYLLFSVVLAGSATLNVDPDSLEFASANPQHMMAVRLGIFFSTILFWWIDVLRTIQWIANGKPDN